MISILQWIGAAIAMILLFPFIMVFVFVVQPICDLIKYQGAPQGCCRTGCSRCPWGNPKLKRYRKDHYGAIYDRPKVSRDQYNEGTK
jgi:hypothetical protein